MYVLLAAYFETAIWYKHALFFQNIQIHFSKSHFFKFFYILTDCAHVCINIFISIVILGSISVHMRFFCFDVQTASNVHSQLLQLLGVLLGLADIFLLKTEFLFIHDGFLGAPDLKGPLLYLDVEIQLHGAPVTVVGVFAQHAL